MCIIVRELRYNLSKHRSLQTLELRTGFFSCTETPGFLETLLPATRSSQPIINVTIIYTESYFYPPRYRPYISGKPTTKTFDRGAWKSDSKIHHDTCQAQLEQFKAICATRRTREFGLALCLEVPGSMLEHAMMALKDDVDAHGDEEVCRLLSETPIVSMIPRIR